MRGGGREEREETCRQVQAGLKEGPQCRSARDSICTNARVDQQSSGSAHRINADTVVRNAFVDACSLFHPARTNHLRGMDGIVVVPVGRGLRWRVGQVMRRPRNGKMKVDFCVHHVIWLKLKLNF